VNHASICTLLRSKTRWGR